MLYRLYPDSCRRLCYAWKDISFEGYQKRICGACGRVVAEMTFNGMQHALLMEGGKEYPDFLSFTGAGKQLFLLSDRAVECLRENEITGFSNVEPVTVCDKKGENLTDAPRYWHLEITGCVDLEFSAMQLKKRRICPSCGQFDWNRQRIPALVLDESSWDGSDLCRISCIPGFTVCSDKFRATVLENALTGFAFSEE